jgi:hypothetical protein
MNNDEIKLLSWSLFSKKFYSSKDELARDVQAFIDRLTALPEEEQLKIIAAAERALSVF